MSGSVRLRVASLGCLPLFVLPGALQALLGRLSTMRCGHCLTAERHREDRYCAAGCISLTFSHLLFPGPTKHLIPNISSKLPAANLCSLWASVLVHRRQLCHFYTNGVIKCAHTCSYILQNAASFSELLGFHVCPTFSSAQPLGTDL